MLTRVVIVSLLTLGFVGSMGFAGGQVNDASIVDESWEGDAKIIGAKDQEDKSMLSLGDTVYLNAGSEGGMTSGLRCGVYRKGDAYKDPKTNKRLGVEVKRIGSVQISKDIEKTHSSAMIIECSEPVQIGDLVKKE